MCGIIGVARFGEEPADSIRESSTFFGPTLTELTESRGKDATGVVTLFDDGNFFGQKMGVSASKFVSRFGGKDDDFEGLLEIMRNYDTPQRIFVGHCRKKSVGNATDNVNNHPIKAESIIGVHNGTLKNHSEIFDNLKCKRDGTVDSEAIFRLMAYFTKGCKEPFTTENLVEVFKRLEGSFSILAFNANNPFQLVSAKDGRPVEYCMVKPLKLVLIASEKGFIDTALWEYNKLSSLHKVPGFAKLKASDVEYSNIKEDQLALFDLTREITDETKITDLYDVEDIPKAAQRIWKSPVTTTYNNHYNNNWKNRNTGAHTSYNKPATNDKPANTTTNPPANGTASTTNNKKKEAVGRVWNDSLEKYVKAFSGKEADGSVVIGVGAKEKSPLSVREAFDQVRKDSERSSENKNFKSISEIKKEANNEEQLELSKEVVQVENFTSSEKTGTIINRKVNNVSSKEAVDDEKVHVDNESFYKVEANKAAKEHLEGLEKFENSAEVASLCNTDAASIAQLPAHALANRLNRLFFVDHFVKGFIAAKQSEEKTTKDGSGGNKYVRVLKALTKGLTSTLDLYVDEDSRRPAYNYFKTLIRGNNELNKDSFRGVFNSGDIRSSSTLTEISKAFEE